MSELLKIATSAYLSTVTTKVASLYKQAGVTWDVNAFDLEPQQLDAMMRANHEHYEKRKNLIEQHVGKFPRHSYGKTGFMGLFGDTYDQKVEKWHKTVKDKVDPLMGPDPEDEHDHYLPSGHERNVNWKMNAYIDMEGKVFNNYLNKDHNNYEFSRAISKAELPGLKKLYNQEAEAFASRPENKDDKWVRPGIEGMNAHLDALMKHPDAKSFRISFG